MNFELKATGISQTQGSNAGERVLFENVTLCWKAPSLQVVMGSSGAGKSTFLKTIGGVWKPSQGQVTFNSKSLWRGSEQNPEVLRHIGFAFQNNALFSSMRVIENVSFPYRQRFPNVTSAELRDLSMDWLKKVGLEQSAFVFPHEMSGGMQKRLSIARTLALKPDFIFLDDPTAGLDPITSKTMAELVQSLLEGSDSLIVIVTNDPDRARGWGPNIHYLSERTLISPDNPKPYAALETRFL